MNKRTFLKVAAAVSVSDALTGEAKKMTNWAENDHFDAVKASGYSVSLFTDSRGQVPERERESIRPVDRPLTARGGGSPGLGPLKMFFEA